MRYLKTSLLTSVSALPHFTGLKRMLHSPRSHAFFVPAPGGRRFGTCSFHLATKEMLGEPFSPSAGERGIPFGLDAEARLAALKRSGAFDIADARISTWSLVLDPNQTVALYATYSNINIRSDRETVLAELGRIARDKFGGRVVRNMTTSLYIARRAA
jgi:hypothetical protein